MSERVIWADTASIRNLQKTGTWGRTCSTIERNIDAKVWESWWGVVADEIHELLIVPGYTNHVAVRIARHEHEAPHYVVYETLSRARRESLVETLYPSQALAQAALSDRAALSRAGLGVRPKTLTHSPFANLKK